jgi:hypothetical protein
VGTLLIGNALGNAGLAAASAGPAGDNGITFRALHPYTDSITTRPDSGPGGTEVRVRGFVSGGNCPQNRNVTLRFVDHAGMDTFLASVPGGSIDVTRNIPTGAALGAGEVRAFRFFFIGRRCMPVLAARTPFTVNTGPGIFGFTPRKGRVGTMVTITGIRFTGVTAVTFNGTPSVFSVDSDSQITSTVPAGATTGPIEVDKPAGPVIVRAISGPDFVVCSGAVC